VASLVLIGSGVRGAPATPDLPAATAELVARIDAAESAGDLGLVNRLEAWLWLDGPSAREGRVAGRARELFLEMNARALDNADPGEQAQVPPAWLRLTQIAAPTLVMAGTLDHERIQAIDRAAASRIPAAQFLRLDAVAHLPHLEADPTTLEHIAQFADAAN
jgi:pimeloyl-ACP methyl ester carboxylesterase